MAECHVWVWLGSRHVHPHVPAGPCAAKVAGGKGGCVVGEAEVDGWVWGGGVG